MKPASLKKTEREKNILVLTHTKKWTVVHKNDESDKYQIANPFYGAYKENYCL